MPGTWKEHLPRYGIIGQLQKRLKQTQGEVCMSRVMGKVTPDPDTADPRTAPGCTAPGDGDSYSL